jgi:hypothetical protein
MDLLAWETVVYTATEPVSTALQIDVLEADGTLLLADVGNGEDLAGIDPAEHPSLKRRARVMQPRRRGARSSSPSRNWRRYGSG